MIGLFDAFLSFLRVEGLHVTLLQGKMCFDCKLCRQVGAYISTYLSWFLPRLLDTGTKAFL